MLNSPGSILQQVRNQLGYTIDDVHIKTKIKKEYIKGLENDDISAFPAELYYKNFLKSYALYLKLNPNELIQIYEQNKIEHQKNLFRQDKDIEKNFVRFYKNNRNLLIYVGWSVCIICLLIIIIVNLPKTIVINKTKQEQSIDRNSMVVSTLTGVVSPKVEEIKKLTVQNKQKLYIKALADTWIKIVADNKDIFEGTITKHFEYKANDEFIVKIGNINTVKVYFNDKLVDIKAGKNSKSNVRTIKLLKNKIVHLTNISDVINKEQEQKSDGNNIVVSTLTGVVSPKVEGIRRHTEKQSKQNIYAKETNTAGIIKKEQEEKADGNKIVVSTLTKVVSSKAEEIKKLTGQNKQKLYIKALADTWVKIIADNKDVFEGTVREHFEYIASDEFIIKIGNIDTVEVYFNDKLVDITAGKNSKSNVRTIKLSRNKNEQE